MDRAARAARAAELMRELEPFQKKCAEEGRPIVLSVQETFTGDDSTPYFVHVTAEWIRTAGTVEAITFLTEILWQTADVPIREKIFSFKIHVIKEEHQPSGFDIV